MNTNPNEDQALACDLTATPSDAREEHVTTAPQLFALAKEVQELSDGFAIRFLNEPGRFMAIAKFIENEQLCCPFFNFGLEVEPNSGPLWLCLTGGEGVKPPIFASSNSIILLALWKKMLFYIFERRFINTCFHCTIMMLSFLPSLVYSSG